MILDFWGNTWKNIMHSWAWLTTWVMPMPLCKLPDSFLHRQPGFKWHFGLWRLYGYIQWQGHTSTWRYAIFERDSGVIWTLILINRLESKVNIFSFAKLLAPLSSNMHIIYYLLCSIYFSDILILICTIIICIIIIHHKMLIHYPVYTCDLVKVMCCNIKID